MNISPFFRNLRTAYRAEIDDLSHDSDGSDVLEKRLREKRKELDFLLQMMTLSPEMVAVIFHHGFTFREPAVMDHLLTNEADELPDWSELSRGIDMQPWAQDLAQTILSAEGGDWFLTVAAGVHYMAGATHRHAHHDDHDAVHSEEEGHDEDNHSGLAHLDADEDDDGSAADSRSRREAGAEWLVGQGFDAKD